MKELENKQADSLRAVESALQIATGALQDIACSSQTENLLWWQVRARGAQKLITECFAAADEQEALESVDRIKQQDEWAPYLKDGEKPFERFIRERNDMSALLSLHQRVIAENEELKAQRPDESPSYGIIDPDYARIYTKARCLAWQEGYALAMHGSFTRDLDLIAVPWTEQACAPEKLAARIADACDLRINGAPGKKPHGRLAFTFLFNGFGDPRFVDLSVIARAATTDKE